MAKEYGSKKVTPMTPEEMGGAATPEKLGRMFAEHDSTAPGTEDAPDPGPFAANRGDRAPEAPAGMSPEDQQKMGQNATEAMRNARAATPAQPAQPQERGKK